MSNIIAVVLELAGPLSALVFIVTLLALIALVAYDVLASRKSKTITPAPVDDLWIPTRLAPVPFVATV